MDQPGMSPRRGTPGTSDQSKHRTTETIAMNTTQVSALLAHIEGMHDDAYLTGHPEWEVIVDEARAIRKPVDAASLEAAAGQLVRSDAGRQALRALSVLFHGKGLDAVNQGAVMTLFAGFWGTLSGTTLDTIDDALGR
jgi:hypothetical protein